MRYSAKTAALLLAVLLLAACTQTPQPSGAASEEPAASDAGQPLAEPLPPAAAEVPGAASEPHEEERYTLYHGGRSYTFDGSGNIIPEEETFLVISDELTGEALYRVYTRQEDTGEDDQWGNPVVEHLSALYDAQGNLLYDWEPINYQPGTGRFLIRQTYRSMFADPMETDEAFYTALWDPASGEEVIEGAATLMQLEQGVYLACGARGEMLGTIDADGNKIGGFPAPVDCYWPNVGNGLILGGSDNPYEPMPDGKARRFFLMDKECRILMEGEEVNVGFMGLRGSYLLRTVDGRREVASLSDFETLYSYDDDAVSLDYFDGERMILRAGKRPNWEYTLCDAGGNPLTEGYDRISFSSSSADDDVPAERFLAQNGDTAFLLDRDGKVLLSAAVPGAADFNIVDIGSDRFYSYSVEGAEGGALYGSYSVGLLDADFDVVIPAGTYDSINRAVNYSKNAAQYFDGWIGHKTVNGLGRCDLLSPDGKVLISNLTTIGTVGENQICAVRGFSMGLMDWNGNWIARHSIHNGFELDD